MTGTDELDREEISLLLPWYANGTLDDDERTKVEEALRTDTALLGEYELILQDQEAAQQALDAAEIPESMALRFSSAVERRFEQQTGSLAPAPSEAGFFERISQSLSGLLAGPRLAMVAAAAILVIAVQGGALVSLMSGGTITGPGFETANEDGRTSEAGLEVLASFAPAASLAGVTEFLTAQGAAIVDGPLPGGLYRLRFKQSDIITDTADAIEILKSEPGLFRIVLPGS